ncbi:type I secretion system ATPase family protein, partial [Vibrio parahaemolyticus V-223/04]
VVTN